MEDLNESQNSWIQTFLERLNPVQYLELYPDLKRMNVKPEDHWLFCGKREGRLPNLSLFYNTYPKFSASEYIKSNADLTNRSEIEGIAHYWAHGFREGRLSYRRSAYPLTNGEEPIRCEYKKLDLFQNLGFKRVWVSDSLRPFAYRFSMIYDLDLNPRAREYLRTYESKIRFLNKVKYKKKRNEPSAVNQKNSKLIPGTDPFDILEYIEEPYIILADKFVQWKETIREERESVAGLDINDNTTDDGIETITQNKNLFFGLYDKFDYLLLCLCLSVCRQRSADQNQQKEIGIIWGGTDLNKLTDVDCLNLILENADRIDHYAISKNVKIRLAEFGILSEFNPIQLHSQEYFQSFLRSYGDQKKGRAIYIYNGLNPGQETKYGSTLYEKIIERIPLKDQIVIFSNQLGLPHEDMPLVYLNACVMLRLTAWDGNANTVQEANTMKIPIFSNFDDSGKALPWSTSEALLSDIMKIIAPKELVDIKRESRSNRGETDNRKPLSFKHFIVACTAASVLMAEIVEVAKAAKAAKAAEIEPTVPTLPTIPTIPTVPSVPTVPAVSEVQEVQEVQEVLGEVPDIRESPVSGSQVSGSQVTEVPEVPEAPEVPEVRKVPEVPGELDFSLVSRLSESDMRIISSNLQDYLLSISDKKKVLLICGDYPGYGGAATNCNRIANYLRTRSCEVRELYYLHRDKTDQLRTIKEGLAKMKNRVIITTKKGLTRTLKTLSYRPDLIILRNCLSPELLSLLRGRYESTVPQIAGVSEVSEVSGVSGIPIHYMVAGLFLNGLDKPYQSRIDDRHFNKSVIETAKNVDRVFLNSQHTRDLLVSVCPELSKKCGLLYFTFIPYLSSLYQIPNMLVSNREKKFVFAVVISDFSRTIKNAEGCCRRILQSQYYKEEEKERVILIGQNSHIYGQKYGFSHIGLVDNVSDYLMETQFLVNCSFYESCSNVVIEAIMAGCEILY